MSSPSARRALRARAAQRPRRGRRADRPTMSDTVCDVYVISMMYAHTDEKDADPDRRGARRGPGTSGAGDSAFESGTDPAVRGRTPQAVAAARDRFPVAHGGRRRVRA